MWWTWIACMTDPLASVGIAPVAEGGAAPATLEVPTTPPMDGAKITGEGAAPAEAEVASTGAPAAAPKPPPAEFNPVSVPQGPRSEGGVQWEGVNKRGTNAPLRPANGSLEYEKNAARN